MTKIFISYRRDDSASAAGRIDDRLAQKYGRDSVFKDVDSIPLGVDFRTVIRGAVGRCQVLLAVIGRDWLRITDASGGRRLDDPADFVRLEIEAALQRDIPVIPVLVGGAAMPLEDQLPPPLQALVFRNGIAVRRDPDFHTDLNRLMKSLDQLLQRESPKWEGEIPAKSVRPVTVRVPEDDGDECTGHEIGLGSGGDVLDGRPGKSKAGRRAKGLLHGRLSGDTGSVARDHGKEPELFLPQGGRRCQCQGYFRCRFAAIPGGTG